MLSHIKILIHRSEAYSHVGYNLKLPYGSYGGKKVKMVVKSIKILDIVVFLVDPYY